MGIRDPGFEKFVYHKRVNKTLILFTELTHTCTCILYFGKTVYQVILSLTILTLSVLYTNINIQRRPSQLSNKTKN